MPGTGRKIVYFLGAGASRGAGAVVSVQGGGEVSIPVQADFWETILRYTPEADRKYIESFLFHYFAGYRHVPSKTVGLTRTRLLNGIDVEEVFTFLSERARAPSTSTQLRTYVNGVWTRLVTTVGSTFQRFEANTDTKRVYRALMRNHVRTHDALVSFNYDTIFERSLRQADPWHYPCVSTETAGLKVLKPHGSVNWRLDGEGIVVEDDTATPVLVAPTHLKFVRGADLPPADGEDDTESQANEPLGYLDVAPPIRDIWTAMEEQMHQAKALVFIGYSFPVADLYFSSVLRSVLASRKTSPRIVIVNPDAVAIGQRLMPRFGLSQPLRYFDIGQFVQVSRESMLAALGL